MANPNPSPATRFGPGNKANPSGKSSELQRLEREAAEMAARLRHKMLSGLTEKAEWGENAADLLTSDVLRLLKDSEDRAHGTPRQSVAVDAIVDGSVRIEADDAFARLASRLAGSATGSTGGAGGAE